MKRKKPLLLSGQQTEDIEKDFSSEQLSGIGKVVIAWNEIESLVNALVYSGLKLPHTLWFEVTVRLSTEGKFDLIKLAAKDLFLPEEICKIIDKTIFAVKDLSDYRNVVVHACIYNAPHGVGRVIRRNGIQEVLLTKNALDTLYVRLILAKKELRAILALFDMSRTYLLYYSSTQINGLLNDREFKRWLQILKDHQKERIYLPAFPKFPK